MSKDVNTKRLSPEGDKFITCYAHGALVIGRVYSIVASQYGLTTAAVPAAMAAPGILAGVCMETASAAGEYVRMQVEGYCEAYVDGDSTDVAAGDSLSVLKSTYVFVQDTSGGAESVNTSGWAVDANADASALKTVYLSGRRAVVAA